MRLNSKLLPVLLALMIIIIYATVPAQGLYIKKATPPTYQSPIAGFKITTQNGKAPLTFQVTDTSKGATSWQYNFGDNTPNVTTKNPVHTYATARTYIVTLTVYNAKGVSSTTKQVVVCPTQKPTCTPTPTCTPKPTCTPTPTCTLTPTPTRPIPGFYVVPQSGQAPLVVHVTDTSKGATSWQYNFGDNTPNVTTKNPVHTYATPGNYTITQTVLNTKGYTSTSKPVVVNPTPTPTPILPTAGFNVVPQSGQAPLNVQVTDNSTGATSWQYSFGDSTPNATTSNPVHTYLAPGNYTIIQTVYNANGSSSTTKPVDVGLSPSPTPSGPTPVDLRSAGNYSILAKSGISTTGATHVTGDIGVSPIAATAITGFGLVLDPSGQFSTSSLVTGKAYAADYNSPTPALLTVAVNDMEAAYTDAAGRPNPNATDLGLGEIGGFTIVPGLYKWTTGLAITQGDVTLDAGGNPDAVWIFQIAQGLTVASGKKIVLTGGAQAKNVFWQVSSDANLGTGAEFNGIILAKTGINLQTGATMNGILLAQTAVTLDSNTVTKT